MTTPILRSDGGGAYSAYLGIRLVGEILPLAPGKFCWRTFLPQHGSDRPRFRIVKGEAAAKMGLLLSIKRWLRDAGLHEKRVPKILAPRILDMVEALGLDA